MLPLLAWAGEAAPQASAWPLDAPLGVLALAVLAGLLGFWLLWRRQALRLTQCQALLAQRDAHATMADRLQTQVANAAQALLAARSEQAVGSQLLSQLAPLLQLGAGLVARWDAESGQLQPLAGYATETANLGASIETSQGLLLQCARSGQALEIANDQAAALRIHSGLGWMQPRCLWLLPVRQGETVCAVLELAMARDLTEADRLLLRALEPVLALNLARVQAVRGAQGGEAPLAAALNLNQSPVALALQRESGATLLVSQRWADWLGMQASDAVLRPLRSFWADGASFAELQRQLRRHGAIESARVSLLHAQGHALHLRLRAWQGELEGETLIWMQFEQLGEGE